MRCISLPVDAAPAQADNVEADQCAGLAERKAERNDIVARRRHAGHHHALADADELMDGDMAAEKGEVADLDMTAEHVLLASVTLLPTWQSWPTWRADHEPAALADAGHAAAVFGAGIHGHAFAQLAVARR